jgi:F-type H+-transporting ATPase subunit a
MNGLSASDPETESSHEAPSFEASEFILDHIADAHEFHILTLPDGHHVSVYLPVILFSKHSGFHVFMSSKLAHGHEYKGFSIAKEGENKGRIVEQIEGGAPYIPLDFSITKIVFTMLLAAGLLMWLFIALGRSYKKHGISEPRGIQGFLEPLILFIRDDIAIVTIGKEKHEKYMPYLLTAFFFIWINNLIGIVPFFPFGANVTGNIAVTFTLAVFTMAITNFSGNKHYWQHIFNTPGVPWWLKVPLPLMPLVELIGVIAKPFALMIRLFANITAGHIIILSLISLIFIFKAYIAFVGPATVVFVLFMDMIELLVALLQAYVFTLLSSLFIGLAVKEEH